MVKASFIMITARSDYPYTNRADLHVFEPTLECFKRQTMTDFEWIIVDALYDARKDYFADVKVPFKIKHIPALPNLWIEQGLPGICTQYNKGIIHADGNLLFFTGDSHMFLPNFMEGLWGAYQAGFFPMAWYFYDNSYAQLRDNPDLHNPTQFDTSFPSTGKEAPFSYDIFGFNGRRVEIEHRYVKTLQNNDSPYATVPWEWWFGCSSASLEAMLKINGFNQLFDGDQMLLDCDVGSRLELAGYGCRFALFRNTALIKIPSDRKWNPKFTNKSVTIKCNYPLIWHSRYFRKYRANTELLSEQDIAWIKEKWCARVCGLRELCKEQHPWQYPFEHKEGYAGHNSSKKWFNFWREHQVLVDLTQEREKRLNGEKYTEGIFV